MTDKQEFNAATVDEAVQKAATALGLSQEGISYEVLDTGSTGFLGIGARDARILVEAAPSSPTPAAPSSEPDVTTAPEEATTPGEAESTGPAATEEDGGTAEDAVIEHAPVSAELLAEVEEFVSSVGNAMGLSSRVDTYDAGDFIAVDVSSEDTALFIGQKGETIDALQYLTNSVVYKNRPYSKRIVLDAEGYRQRRVEAVQGMAHRSARRAMREGRAVELPPMSSAERRIVHVYLQENPGVTTASDGSGASRRVTISPT